MRPWHFLAALALVVAGVLIAGWLDLGKPNPTYAHTYQECLSKSAGIAPRPCFVIDDGVLVELRDDPSA